MPLCNGRPDGPCPDKRCDQSVHLSQGDLMLCDSCERFRFPEVFKAPRRTTAKSVKHASSPASASTSSVKSGKHDPSPAGTSTSSISSKTKKHIDLTEAKTSVSDVPQSHTTTDVPRTVFNELLMYVGTFRNRSSIDNIRKVIVHFYSASEISDAKKAFISVAGEMITGCDYLTERRTSTQRSASDAEADDIIHLFDVLDSCNSLKELQFAALSYERLPKYGPEEVNICAVVDKQIHTDSMLADLSTKIDSLSADRGSLIKSPDPVSDFDVNKITKVLGDQLQASTQSIQDQLTQLAVGCSQLSGSSQTSTSSSSAAGHTNDTNLYAIANQNAELNSVVKQLAVEVETLNRKNTTVPDYGSVDMNLSTLVDGQTKLKDCMDSAIGALSTQIVDLTSMCTQFHESFKDCRSSFSATSGTSRPTTNTQKHCTNAAAEHRSTDSVDRSRNLVLYGVEESQDASVWRSAVTTALHEAVGRDVMIDDAFRLGKHSPGRKRPILV